MAPMSCRYEIHIRGRLTEALLGAFEELSAEVEPVQTVLHGNVADQASLYGLLQRIQALGLELVEVRRLPDDSAATGLPTTRQSADDYQSPAGGR
jgi:hypothetical protein